MSCVDEIIASLNSILDYKKKGTTDIDKIIAKLIIEDSQLVRDLIKIVFDDRNNNMEEIELKIKDHLKSSEDSNITYQSKDSVKVLLVFSNEFSFGKYFNLDDNGREKFNEMVTIILKNQTKNSKLSVNRALFTCMPSHIQAKLLKSFDESTLRKQLCLSKPRENFLTNRVASLWNELPDTVVSAKSTNAFKDKFDKFRSQQLAANDTTIVELPIEQMALEKREQGLNTPWRLIFTKLSWCSAKVKTPRNILTAFNIPFAV
ncbi:hypothetical protein BpHYR1_023956 [Brachionus plicatilis]|uniref:Uncharacterized protein n=1 Tax=Brachionus plicatilis TaxID=10195 RepID=A0A3M7SQ15_BRAPC|nr:hypothetical protein BpHYR1_023956 [Brachionus plicatilis]